MQQRTVLAIAIIAAIIIVIFGAYETMQANFGGSYKIYSSQDDKCAAQSGYTDASWREHMSHHPDQYAECLS